MALLDISGLTVEFGTEKAPFKAVDGVDFAIDAGEIVGVVGESGSGKTVTALALMGLIDFPGRVRARSMVFAGRDLATISDRQRRAPALDGHITRILLLVIYKMICYFVNYVYQKAG